MKNPHIFIILQFQADTVVMNKGTIEIYSDGKRKQYRYFCKACGKQLSDSAHPSENIGTREEIGNLLCKTCQKEIENKFIQPS
jgi:predicted SprT family Zn-dependent metalloprotease